MQVYQMDGLLQFGLLGKQVKQVIRTDLMLMTQNIELLAEIMLHWLSAECFALYLQTGKLQEHSRCS